MNLICSFPPAPLLRSSERTVGLEPRPRLLPLQRHRFKLWVQQLLHHGECVTEN